MIDLGPLFEEAFLEGEAREANALLAEARALYPSLAPAGAGEPFSYEVVVPEAPELDWLAHTLLPRLVYHCETRRAPLPDCGGIFVSAFVKDRLFCVPAGAVVRFGAEQLGVGWEQLVEAHGTGEARHALGRDPEEGEEGEAAAPVRGLLPGGES